MPKLKKMPLRGPARINRLAIGGLALFVAVVGIAVVLQAKANTTCTVDAKLVNSCRPWLAAAVSNYPMAGDRWTTSVQFPYFEKRLNNPEVLSDPSAPTTVTKKLDFVHDYRGYGAVLSNFDISMVNRANTYLQLNWKAVDTKWAMGDGRDATHNSNIDRMANSIKSVAPKKILLAVFHEPENDVTAGTAGANCAVDYKGTYGSPAEYRAMWQNVRNRFDALGVTNVVWAMNYMGYQGHDCLVSQMWPGNHLVDWVQWDPYDGGTATFATSISRFYNFLTNTSNANNDYNSKPWGVAEFGYWNQNGDSTPTEAVKYWQQAKTSIETNQFPKVKLWSVFDSTPDGTYEDSAFVGLQFAPTAVIDKNEQTAYNAFATAVLNYGATVATPTPTPVSDTAPPTVNVVNAGELNGTVTLTANASDNIGVTRVEYYLNGTKLGEAATSPYSVPFDTTSRPNGTYQLTAKAFDAAGNVGNSPGVSVTINNPDTTAPTVNITSPADNATVEGTVSVVAEAADNVGVTKVDFAYSGTVLGSSSVTAAGPYTVNWDTSSLADGPYLLSATAFDAAGNTTSTNINVTVDNPEADTQAPTAPGGLSAVAVAFNRVDLSWTASSDNSGSIAKYQIWRDNAVLAETAALSYADTTVVASTTYAYEVKAIDASGNVSPTSGRTVVTTPVAPDTTRPSAPTNLTAAAAAHNQVNLSWGASTDNSGSVAKYYVYRGGAVIAETTGLSFIDNTVSGSTTYSYVVRALDPSGNVSFGSNIASVTTPSVPDTAAPTAPTGLIVTSVSPKQVNLSWSAAQDNVGVAAYYVYRDGVLIGTLPASARTFGDGTVSSRNTYRYHVIAADAAGNTSAPSNTVSITTKGGK
jgi:chitodextrinase